MCIYYLDDDNSKRELRGPSIVIKFNLNDRGMRFDAENESNKKEDES